MLRRAFFLLSGDALGSALALARNLLVARSISVEDYGIAATLFMVVTVAEMASALGLQQQIVQAQEGDQPRFQAALQGLQVLRGLLSALVLIALSQPLVDLMNVPQARSGLVVIAALPVLWSLIHFDIYRLGRTMRFGPAILVSIVPPALSVLSVWPLALWLGDWWTMVGALLVHWSLAIFVSHLAAERPYRVVFDRAIMARSLAFGWPLLLSGVLLFFVFNGDRFIVGRELGMVALGLFSMAVTLTLTPTLVLERSLQSVFLPRLSRIDRSDPSGTTEFVRLASLETEAHFATALGFLIAVAIVGAPILHLLLGPRYEGAQEILVPLAALQAMRLMKGAPNVMALAAGRTGLNLAASLPRVASLPLAWWAVTQTGSLWMLLAVALAAEASGYLTAAVLVRRVAPGWLTATTLQHFGAAALVATTLALMAVRPASSSIDPLSASVLLLLFGAHLATLRSLRGYLAMALGRRGPNQA
jgi:O-antigen/teichoic acid export membrane protein